MTGLRVFCLVISLSSLRFWRERERLLGPSYIFGWALWLDDINEVILGCRRFWGCSTPGDLLERQVKEKK